MFYIGGDTGWPTTSLHRTHHHGIHRNIDHSLLGIRIVQLIDWTNDYYAVHYKFHSWLIFAVNKKNSMNWTRYLSYEWDCPSDSWPLFSIMKSAWNRKVCSSLQWIWNNKYRCNFAPGASRGSYFHSFVSSNMWCGDPKLLLADQDHLIFWVIFSFIFLAAPSHPFGNV